MRTAALVQARRFAAHASRPPNEPIAIYVAPDREATSRRSAAANELLQSPSRDWPLPGAVRPMSLIARRATVQDADRPTSTRASKSTAVPQVKPKSRPSLPPFTSLQQVLNNSPSHLAPNARAQHEMTSNVEAAAAAAQKEVGNQAEMRPRTVSDVEAKAQSCPRLMRAELGALFPTAPVSAEKMTIVNVSLRTQHEQSAWSAEQEHERERVIADFIEAARAACAFLNSTGHWADFIDPASGRPFHSGYTPVTLFETDPAYQQMGFRIEDLGCCKVLEHAKWGARVFVGSLFTSAPVDSAEVRQLLETVNMMSTGEEEPRAVQMDEEEIV